MSDTSKREELIRAVQAVTWNASNYPPKIQPHVLGQDIVPLTMKIVDAVEAVFEQVHTPTDDEREALVREVSLAHAEAWSDERECAEAPDRIADAVLAAGFRRTVQGEPTDAQVLAALNAYYADYMIGPNKSLSEVRPPRTVHDMRAALRAAAATQTGEQA